MNSNTQTQNEHEPIFWIDSKTDEGKHVIASPDIISPFPYSYISTPPINGNYKIKMSVPPDLCIIDGNKSKTRQDISTKITFNHAIRTYTLLHDGWLPIPFVPYKKLLLDRNVISILQKNPSTSHRKDHSDTKWWLNLAIETQTFFNIFPYCMEGNRKSTPSYNDFKISYFDSVSRLKSLFPSARIITYQEIHLNEAYALVEEINKNHENEVNFLSQINTIILHRLSNNKLTKACDKIIAAAIKYKIHSNPLLLLSALSCLYEDKNSSGLSPARRVLKPKKSFSSENAYNALSDLRMLYVSIQSKKILNEETPLCTCDKHLAALWCSLVPIKVENDNSPLFKVKFTVTEDTFPRLDASQRQDLINKIENF